MIKKYCDICGKDITDPHQETYDISTVWHEPSQEYKDSYGRTFCTLVAHLRPFSDYNFNLCDSCGSTLMESITNVVQELQKSN